MAYCRWSDCDVYVYEDVRGGWTTHVAARRTLHVKGPPIDTSSPDAIIASWKAREQFHRDHPEMYAIDLPHAGESFNDPTPGECADRLAELAQLGFDVPLDVIDELRDEQREIDAGPGDLSDRWDNA